MPSRLQDPIALGGLNLRNRLYRAPVLEGAGSAKNPAKVYAKHFVPNAEAGVGLIIQGNTIVQPEGRTSPGMSAVHDRESLLVFRPMTEAIHKAGGRIVIQLGHGGTYALESWHQEAMAARTRPPLAPSPLPWWIRLLLGKVHIPSTEEVEGMIQRFGQVASWAREAGYDGVQLAGSNAKLLHQFLSPVYNRRTDKYGGDLDGRTRILREIRESIAQQAGSDFPVLLKYTAVESTLWGTGLTLEEGVAIAKKAEEWGFQAVTPVIADMLPNTAICRGDFPKHTFRHKKLRQTMREAAGNAYRFYVIVTAMWFSSRRYPFLPVWNRPVFSAVRDAVSLPVFAVGGIRTPQEAAGILGQGEADLIGVGRPFYAEPLLPKRFLAASEDEPFPAMACENCNRCIMPQMVGMAGVCYNPETHQRRKELAAMASPPA